MICPRCCKQTDGIHTCTPTKGWRELERQRDDLLAALEKVCAKSHRGTVWLDIEEVDALKAAIASAKGTEQ